MSDYVRILDIEVNGETKHAHVFASMWEYIQFFGASVEDYVLSPEENEGDRIVRSFKPVDDPFFSTFSSDMANIDGEYYQHVNWGEDEYAMIPEGDLDVSFWFIYEWTANISGYWTNGNIYRTKEAAEADL